MPLFVTVTPGTTVTSSTTLDASTLNLLGTPSVDVTGSVDGGSLTLGSNSVSTTAIINGAVNSDKLASDSVIEAKILNSAVTTGKINDGAVTTAKLASSSSTTTGVTFAKIQQIASGKLLGNSSESTGSVETVSVGDGLTLSAISGLKTNSLLKKQLNNAGSESNIATLKYLSSEEKTIPTDAGSNVSLVLGAGVVPQQFGYYFKCITEDTTGGYLAGDFVDFKSVFGGDYKDLFVLRVTAGTIYLIRTNASGSFITNTSTGNSVIWTPAKWKVVITATIVS